jgi:alpha-amylase/alpha-mannosidase (GH57 family)
MWPSEGSVSRQACELIVRNGLTWAASDNMVLANSLGRKSGNLGNEDLYSPWELQTNEGPLNLFFRDTEFSDLLGFTYQYWDAEKAVNDFVARLEDVSDSFPSEKTPLVPVILDGENAWAYYKDNGRDFLSTLFRVVQEADWIETILPSEFITREEYKPRELNRLVAGSWIYGNLTTWIGHQEKNRAWELLTNAREDFEEHAGSANVSEEDKALARKELFIAEGSDWFWWYGDDHETAYAREFDSLFREHLANIYHFLELDPPQDLFESIKGSEIQSDIEPPLRLISPTLDGYVTRYTEWINSGLYFSSGGSEMMHKASGLLKCIRFGFDQKNIYLRFDGTRPFTEKPLSGHHLTVKVTAPKQARIVFDFDTE